jgi:hypothetical protein
MLILFSIGISTKPPLLMMAWYNLTGNMAAMERMQMQGGMGGPPPGMM